jgi:hypothetical protein
MGDYLEQLCESMNIKLTYSESKFPVFSGRIMENGGYIKASTIFKNCPHNVADSIIKYYKDSENQDEYLKIIDNFIENRMKNNDKAIEKSIDQKAEYNKPEIKVQRSNYGAKENDNENMQLVELEISSIVKSNFYSGSKSLNPDETIKPTNDDVIELDIEVKPFTT